MNKKSIFLILFLLLNAVGCSSVAPNHFKGISTTWADYPTKPDPKPAEVDWYVAKDSSYAELTVRSKSRGEVIDIPNGVPVKFELRRGEWRWESPNKWGADVRQIGDSLWLGYGVGDGGVSYKLERRVVN